MRLACNAMALGCGHCGVPRVGCTKGVDTRHITIHKGTITQAGLDVNAILAISDDKLRLSREACFRTQMARRASDAVVPPPEATEFLATEYIAFVSFATRAASAWRKVCAAMQEVGDDTVLFVRDVKTRFRRGSREQAGRGISFL